MSESTPTVYDNSGSIALFHRDDLAAGTVATGPMRSMQSNDEELRAWYYDDATVIVSTPDGAIVAEGALVAYEGDKDIDHTLSLKFSANVEGYRRHETYSFNGWDNTGTSQRAKREGKINDLQVINLRLMRGAYINPRREAEVGVSK